jgi:hypothetical protein
MAGSKSAGKVRTRSALEVLSAVTTVLLLAGLAAGAVVGVPALQRQATQRLSTRPVRVQFDWPIAAGAPTVEGRPRTWLDERFQIALTNAASDAASDHTDRLGTEQLAAVSDAAMRTGWFVRPPRVWREGDLLRVSGVWHVQAAVVRRGEVDRLIGWGGELLPFECPAGESGLPAIVAPRAEPPRDARGRLRLGMPWPGEDVRAALDLLALMQKQEYWSQVRGVEIAEFDRHGRGGWLVILTDGGRVVWGARVSASAIERGEVSTERKLGHMAQLFSQTGRIDGGRREVEVRSEVVIVNETAGAQGP